MIQKYNFPPFQHFFISSPFCIGNQFVLFLNNNIIHSCMKKILCSLLGSLMVLTISAQNDQLKEPTKVKKSQNEMRNDLYLAYNYGSLYLTNPYADHSYYNYPELYDRPDDAYSLGGLTMGYNRSLNRVVMFGFMLCYENFASSGNYDPDGSGTIYSADINDHVISEMAMFTVNYVNKPVVRLYSAAGLGVSVVFSHIQGSAPDAVAETDRQAHFAGQWTLIGLRVGRTIGGFFEIGMGSAAMLSGGISYKFSD
jgi:hypothetical protein